MPARHLDLYTIESTYGLHGLGDGRREIAWVSFSMIDRNIAPVLIVNFTSDVEHRLPACAGIKQVDAIASERYFAIQ